ncbi:ZSCA4 protein, partial [Acromyrmex insinuator]
MSYSDSWSNFPHYSRDAAGLQSFSPKDAVVRHQRFRGDHRERRFFRCIYCEYQSKYSSNVYKHMRRIHKHMPFFKPNRLDRHIIEHKERYFCPRCNSSFSKKSNMLTHYRHECGKAPRFQCPYCGKKDRKSSNTYRHIRMHHKGSSIQAYRLY